MTLSDCIRSIELRTQGLLYPCEVVYGFTLREIIETFVWTEFHSIRGIGCFHSKVSDVLKSSSFTAVQNAIGASEVDHVNDSGKASRMVFMKFRLKFRRTGDVFQINQPIHGRPFAVSHGPTENDLKKVFRMTYKRDLFDRFLQHEAAQANSMGH